MTSMIVVIVVLATVAVAIGAGFLGIILGKELVMKNPVIIAGHRKKNRVVIRDERLKPAFWKMQKWFTWSVFAASGIPVLVGFAVFYSNWPLVIGIVAVGAVLLPVLLATWHKSKANFYHLVEAWGVVMEKEETVVKGAVAHQLNKLFPLLILMTICMSLLSILQFFNGNLILGSFGALVAAYTFGYTVFVAVKKQRA